MKEIALNLLSAIAVSIAASPSLSYAGLGEGTAAYESKDYGKALQLLVPVAQQGNAQAQRLLGSMYLQGMGTPQNETDAAKWFRLAAAQGDGASMQSLASLLIQGRGVQYDVEEATQWFRRAQEVAQAALAKTPADEGTSASLPAAQESVRSCTYPDPSIPGRIYDRNIAGVVRASVLIDDGVAKDVIIFSGPKAYHEPFRKALMRMDCAGKKVHAMSARSYTTLGYGPDSRPVYTVSAREMFFEFGSPPFQSNWKGLSFEHKMSVRALYVNMPADDEPPYPVDGMGELLENLRLVAERLESPGALRLNAKISAGGKVEAVNVLASPDSEMGKIAADVVYQTPFKPALCAKQACAMTFPIDVFIRRTVLGDESAARKAVNALREAAQKGDPLVQNELGERYEYGDDVAKDIAQAIEWYVKAANQGNLHAQMALARIYSAGRATAADLPQATVWLRKAAEQGYYRAQFRLGVSYRQGYGLATDKAEGMKWYRKSAEQAYVLAINNIGDAYESGEGVAVDFAEAFKWYSLAADQGLRSAINSLAHMYLDGRGVPQDASKGLSMLQVAADKGHVKAQFDLAQMYASGTDVEKDADLAVKWYRRAAKSGSKEAIAKLKDLGLAS